MVLGQSSAAAPNRTPETSAAYLERVRENSNYHALRSLIAVVFWLLLIALWGQIAIVVLAAGVMPFLPVSRAGDGGLAWLTIVTGVGCGGLGTVLLLAGRQAAMLVIDIADTLLEAHRRKG